MTQLLQHSSILAILTSLILSNNANAASTPQVDFDRMGKVAIAGSFAGLDLYDNALQSSSFDPSTSTIFLRGADGGLSPIGATNPGGSVVAGCSLGGDQFYFGGTFTSVAGQNAANIIAYNPSTKTFSTLSGGGLDGPVETLYCDRSSQTLWAGGAFNGPSSSSGPTYGGSVAVYTPGSNTWSPPGFGGLSGTVSSIVSNSDSSSLLFGGSFITSYQSSGSSNNTNITIIRNPNVPQSTGSTPFSSSLVPFPLSAAEVTAGPSSSQQGLGDIKSTFCPAGPDGAGFTWLAGEGFFSQITIRDFRALTASGIRLGNTFFDNRSTTVFCVTSLPSNELLTLRYNVPGSDETRTCTEDCPLSTDSSVEFQDFLFTSPPIFGVQINLKEWEGEGAGLHLLQLLSDGSFASAIVPDESSCYSPGPSNVQTTGLWTSTTVTTSIPATTQTVLTSTVAVGSTSSPTLNWNIYTSTSGQYDVYLLSPGCVNMQNCESRTSVDVTINAGGSVGPVTTTVSQQNQQDAELLVYSGLIIPSARDFTVPVSLALAANPTGSGSGGRYTLVADRIVMRLTSADTSSDGTTSTGGGGNGTTTAGAPKRAFGLYEWPLRNSPQDIDATGVLPNNTETALTTAAFGLFSGLGSTTAASQAVISSVVSYTSDKTVIGGKFRLSDGTTNVALSTGGTLSALAGEGLGGTVTSMVLYGDTLFVGGTFNATADGATPLRNVAVYNLANNQWGSLGGGVDGPVASIGLSNGHVTVVGNFTRTLITSTTALGASGLASWDIKTAKWINSGGLIVGTMASVFNATQENSEYITGNVNMYLKYGADGAASLKNGENGNAAITPLGVRLDGPASVSTSTRKRVPWTGLKLRDMLAPRQTPGQAIPPDAVTPAPSVLSGVFWTNTTSSHEVMVIGGNFSVPGTQTTSLAVYDPEDESVTGMVGAQIDGIVRALMVVGSKLYVGGEFSLQGVSGRGFAIYDLDAQSWDSRTSGLTATTGQPIVRSLSALSSGSTTVIVAGSFTSAGSTQCGGICAYDTNSQAWSALGSGTTGDVESVSYAGSNAEILLAAGSLTVGGAPAYLASYFAQNQTWSPLGTLPGPVTAVGVNDRNQSSVFAAGKTSSGAFVSHWDGVQWTTVDLPLSATSNITHLEMIPLQQEHDSTTLVGSDRVLWISGSLAGTNFTHAASALYDGQTLYPYLVTSTASGDSGSVSSFFHSFSTFSFSSRGYLPLGVVILISIALGAGIVFLLGLIGILWALFARRDDRSFGQDTVVEDDDSVRPSSLLAHVNAAARNTILGTPKNDYYVHKGDETVVEDHATADSHGAAITGAGVAIAGDHNPLTPTTTIDEHDVNRPSHARYSFDGKGEGELPLSVGQQVTVLNDQDPSWWFVRDNATQKEGVVPATHLV